MAASSNGGDAASGASEDGGTAGEDTDSSGGADAGGSGADGEEDAGGEEANGDRGQTTPLRAAKTQAAIGSVTAAATAVETSPKGAGKAVVMTLAAVGATRQRM